MAIALLPPFKAGADLPSSFPEVPYFSQDTLFKLMDPDNTPSFPLQWEEEYPKAKNFWLNENDPFFHLLALNPADATEAGSACNEQRCYPYNPFRETVLTVEHLQNINMCKQTLKLPVCKRLREQKPKDLKNCEDPSDLNASSSSVSGTYVMGCMLGVKSFAEGMWEFAKMVGRGAVGAVKMPFSPSAREKWQRDYNARFMPAKEKFIAFVKQAFRKEYNRHRRNFPRGSVGDMGASIQVAHLYFPKLWEKVMGVVEEQTEKIQCMNEGAKMRVGCMVLAEASFEVAPALLTGGGTLALAMVMRAKKGERLADVFEVPGGGGKRAVSGNLTDRERIAEAGRLLSKKLTPDQERALLEAHLVGKGARGADGGPAKLGNYTQAQIVRKGRILRRAGFSPDETRKLMDEGVVGALNPFHAITNPVAHSFYESAGFYDSPIGKSLFDFDSSSSPKTGRRRNSDAEFARQRLEEEIEQFQSRAYDINASHKQLDSEIEYLKTLAQKDPSLKDQVEKLSAKFESFVTKEKRTAEAYSEIGQFIDSTKEFSSADIVKKRYEKAKKEVFDLNGKDMINLQVKAEVLHEDINKFYRENGIFRLIREDSPRPSSRKDSTIKREQSVHLKILQEKINEYTEAIPKISHSNGELVSNIDKLDNLITDPSRKSVIKEIRTEANTLAKKEDEIKKSFEKVKTSVDLKPDSINDIISNNLSRAKDRMYVLNNEARSLGHNIERLNKNIKDWLYEVNLLGEMHIAPDPYNPGRFEGTRERVRADLWERRQSAPATEATKPKAPDNSSKRFSEEMAESRQQFREEMAESSQQFSERIEAGNQEFIERLRTQTRQFDEDIRENREQIGQPLKESKTDPNLETASRSNSGRGGKAVKITLGAGATATIADGMVYLSTGESYVVEDVLNATKKKYPEKYRQMLQLKQAIKDKVFTE